MESPKFTSGEWKVLRDGFGGLHIDEHSRTVVIAQVCAESPTEEDEANAKLIAAAPDLFECLLEAIESMELETNNVSEKWKNAIKKATE